MGSSTGLMTPETASPSVTPNIPASSIGEVMRDFSLTSSKHSGIPSTGGNTVYDTTSNLAPNVAPVASKSEVSAFTPSTTESELYPRDTSFDAVSLKDSSDNSTLSTTLASGNT